MNAAEAHIEGSAAHKRGDYVEALRLFRVAAEQGGAEAQYVLGVMYINGRGTPTDYEEAAKWFHRGAEQGDIDSLYMLGCCYDEGWGVQKNDVHAHMWLSLAAGTGYERAIEDLARVAKRMTPSQIAEAEKLVSDAGAQPIIPPCDRTAR
jgi:TPR repeat protein